MIYYLYSLGALQILRQRNVNVLNCSRSTSRLVIRTVHKLCKLNFIAVLILWCFTISSTFGELYTVSMNMHLCISSTQMFLCFYSMYTCLCLTIFTCLCLCFTVCTLLSVFDTRCTDRGAAEIPVQEHLSPGTGHSQQDLESSEEWYVVANLRHFWTEMIQIYTPIHCMYIYCGERLAEYTVRFL